MSKTTTPALAGLTAVQIREMLDNKQVTKTQVVAFLREKEERIGLRYPAKKLLAEPKAAKPAPTPEPAKDVLADLLVQVRLLTERVAALEGVKAAPTPAPAKPEPKPVVTPEPAKTAPKPTPAKAAPKPEAKPAPVVEADEEGMTEAEAREEFATLKVAQLREIADFDCTGMSKAEIIDEMVAQAIEDGVVIAAPAKAQSKPDLRVVARDVSVEF